MNLSSSFSLCRFRGFIIVILLVCETISELNAFSPSTTSTKITSKRRRQQNFSLFPSTTTPTTTCSTSLFGVRWDPSKTNAANTDDDKVFVDFPTPSQRKVLKKEVKKQQARKELVTITLPQDDDGGDYYDQQMTAMDADDDDHDVDEDEEEDGRVEFVCPFESSTVQAVWDAFTQKETEVLQVRGLSRQNKALVFTVAEILCWAMESIQEIEEEEEEEEEGEGINDDGENDSGDDKDNDVDTFAEDAVGIGEEGEDEIPPIHEVALLSTKGHAAILYCPHLESDHPNKIVLRTSVGQKNTWKARVKAPRDDRGQIIPKEIRDEFYRQQQQQQ